MLFSFGGLKGVRHIQCAMAVFEGMIFRSLSSSILFDNAVPMSVVCWNCEMQSKADISATYFTPRATKAPQNKKGNTKQNTQMKTYQNNQSIGASRATSCIIGSEKIDKEFPSSDGKQFSEFDTKWIRTPAGRAQWISSPSPEPLGHSVSRREAQMNMTKTSPYFFGS